MAASGIDITTAKGLPRQKQTQSFGKKSSRKTRIETEGPSKH
jgi:hypothetical protein